MSSHSTSGKQRPRRAVVDNMRRKIERALAVAEPAEELAKAAKAVIAASEAERVLEDRPEMGALRAALARYREAHDGLS